MGIGLREYMEKEERDPTEPEEFYRPVASDTPRERTRRLSGERRWQAEEGDDE